jgi:glyoxylase-like metal-dependent hydrolase (beta-lactamase superfamily II)
MGDYTVIDTKMHGRDGITGAFLLRAAKTTLIETGPKSSVEHVLKGLENAGVDHLDWILVTHIHLDHAGAAGTLATRFPDATVGVHEVGAPHLVDPSKLWSSASRIYGDEMEKLWGGIDPIEPDRIHKLSDGDSIDLGDRALKVVETLGHAGHHHAYLDDSSGTMFTGDAMGVRLPDVGVFRPATPPPEFNLDAALASLDRIRDVSPASVVLTHFGASDDGERPLDVNEACDEAADALRTWHAWVSDARTRTRDIDEVTEYVRAEAHEALEGRIDPADLERMEQTTSYRMNASGYMRYLDKRAEAAS